MRVKAWLSQCEWRRTGNWQRKFNTFGRCLQVVRALFICGSGYGAQAVRMIRKIAAAGLASVLLGCLPAHAQEIQDVPELEGAPAPLKIPPAQPKPQPQSQAKPQVKAPVATPKPPAQTADNAKALAALKAEQAKLDKQAADLKAQQVRLDTRAAELAAREKGISEREARLAAEQAELARQSDDVAKQLAEASARPAPAPAPVVRRDETPAYEDEDQPGRYARIDREEAIRACARAGDDEARARRYYSARYGSEPQFYAGRISELRGVMRVEDRRGYLILDSVCEVDSYGDVRSFTFLR